MSDSRARGEIRGINELDIKSDIHARDTPCEIKANFKVDFSVPLQDEDMIPHPQQKSRRRAWPRKRRVADKEIIPRAAKTRSKIKSLSSSLIIISDSSDDEIKAEDNDVKEVTTKRVFVNRSAKGNEVKEICPIGMLEENPAEDYVHADTYCNIKIEPCPSTSGNSVTEETFNLNAIIPINDENTLKQEFESCPEKEQRSDVKIRDLNREPNMPAKCENDSFDSKYVDSYNTYEECPSDHKSTTIDGDHMISIHANNELLGHGIITQDCAQDFNSSVHNDTKIGKATRKRIYKSKLLHCKTNAAKKNISCPRCYKKMKRASLILHLLSHYTNLKMQQKRTCKKILTKTYHVKTTKKCLSHEQDNFLGCGKVVDTEDKRMSKDKRLEPSNTQGIKINTHIRNKENEDTKMNDFVSSEAKNNQCSVEFQSAGSVNAGVKKCEECGEMIPGYIYASHLLIHEKITKSQCELCGKLLSSEYYLRKHILIHNTDRESLSCKFCAKTYKSRSGLDSHVKKKHRDRSAPNVTSTEEITSNKVNESTPQVEEQVEVSQEQVSESDLQLNSDSPVEATSMQGKEENAQKKSQKANKRKGPTKVNCGKCGLLIQKRWLEKHIKVVHNGPKKDFKCKICEKLVTSTYLDQHMKTHGHKKVKCDICGKLLISKIGLKAHTKSVHKERDMSCKYCSGKFKTKNILFNHVYRIHKNDVDSDLETADSDDPSLWCREKTCFTCKVPFTTELGLFFHRRNFHQTQHPCPIGLCNKVFSTKKTLKVHLNWHKREEVEKSNVCPHCGKTFERHAVLKKHIKYHCINKIAPEKLPCKICGKLISSTSMNLHKKFVHKSKEKEACPVCGKMIVKKSMFLHMKSHEDPQYRCGECGKLFTLKHQLNNHMLSHGDERKFVCTFCPLKFKMAHHLRSHLKTQHKK